MFWCLLWMWDWDWTERREQLVLDEWEDLWSYQFLSFIYKLRSERLPSSRQLLEYRLNNMLWSSIIFQYLGIRCYDALGYQTVLPPFINVFLGSEYKSEISIANSANAVRLTAGEALILGYWINHYQLNIIHDG